MWVVVCVEYTSSHPHVVKLVDSAALTSYSLQLVSPLSFLLSSILPSPPSLPPSSLPPSVSTELIKALLQEFLSLLIDQTQNFNGVGSLWLTC